MFRDAILLEGSDKLKPVVFFSHSSADSEILRRLKTMFLDKVGGTIDVFLSSDGQSIPLGRNWVHRVQQGLETAKIMLVFLTPNAVRSNWIFFEAGFAYSKGIRVVPIGILGIDLGRVPPPLGLLQGFNISSQDGLDNIIALMNEEFGYSIKTNFTTAEYTELMACAGMEEGGALGEAATLLDEISITVKESVGDHCLERSEIIEQVAALLTEEGTEFQRDETQIDSFGLLVHVPRPPSSCMLLFEENSVFFFRKM